MLLLEISRLFSRSARLSRLAVLALLLCAPAFSQNTCPEPAASDFRKVSLDANGSGMANPVDLAVAADGRVLFAEQNTGKVHLYKPGVTGSKVIGAVPVFFSNQEGLIAIELDPGFVQNGWAYLFYSRKVGSVTNEFLSRFTITGDSLIPSSEKILLSFARPENDNHAGGGLAFDARGDLYLATGDNTDDGVNGNFGAFDSRTLSKDAARTSANTNDLRGKVLRIHPEADGTYSIPSGNLWQVLNLTGADTAKVRKEIYAMGFRNPYRISVDKASGRLFLGEVGPDAKAAANPALGPIGYDELNVITAPGFYGWPYFSINQPYNVVTYSGTTATVTAAVFDSARPANNSPNNTGLAVLPPARAPLLWYTYGATAAFPGIPAGTANTIIAGPVYNYSPGLNSAIKFPPYYDGRAFFGDWSRSWLQTAALDGAGRLTATAPFIGSNAFIKRNLSFDFGADGALYVLQWGTGSSYANGGELYRIEYTGALDNSCLPARVRGEARAGARTGAPLFLNGGALEIPPEFHGADVFALDGTRLARVRRNAPGNAHVTLPANHGVVRVRYF